jgi:dipeptidyl aminopeptidase/acylaminoacyl peptidase
MAETTPRTNWIWGLATLAAVIVGLGVFTSRMGSSSCQVAEKAPRVMTPADVARLKQVGQVAVSPDGKHIAYMLYVQRTPGEDEDGSAWRELHVVDAAGNSRPFVSGKVQVSKLKWTPDGKRISYVAKRFDDKHASLYAIPLGGGESRKVVGHDTAIGNYAFSADGGRVAFLAKSKLDEAIKKAKKKGFNAKIFEEEPRPTGVWTAALTDGLVAKGTKASRILLDGSASTIAFNPDGQSLAVSIAPTPRIDDYYMKRKVHILSVATGVIRGTLETSGKIGHASYSPNGKQIAMIAGADPHDPAAGRLMVAASEGGELKAVLPLDAEEHVRDFDWIDDDTLVFLSDRGMQTVVGTVKADGSDARLLVGPSVSPSSVSPSGSPEGSGPVVWQLSVSRASGTAALLGDSPDFPAEVFSLDLKSAAPPKRLTVHNAWLADITLGKQEAVSYKARDGLDVGGVLVHPVGVEEGERVPLVLVVHGGPESHVKNGWVTTYSRPGQTGAGRGWAVFYPNYRGSTGRGVAFSKKGQSDYAGGEFDDLVDAITHFDTTGLIDKTKVGITGGSYGGFASAWGATKLTEHFAASVMFVGISDHVSKAGTTDIPNEMYMVHARRWPWKHWDWFRERSPIHYIEQARTPILIMHGEKDTRVHPSQSMELYRYIKLIGKTPTRLVLYPGEGHGNRKAAARLDYSLRQLRWLEHYLVGAGGDPPAHAVDHAAALGQDKPGPT